MVSANKPMTKKPITSGDVREHDVEPLLGLPECLPVGERLLWQGSPQTWALARHVFHFNKVWLWFTAVTLWQVFSSFSQTGTLSPHMLFVPAVAMALALGIIYLLAWLYARSTVYSLTSHRITMRFGLALQITMNLPFGEILKADVSDKGNDIGNIAFTVAEGTRVSHLVLWPNVRPWHWIAPQPMFCCVDGLSRASAILTHAVTQQAAGSDGSLQTSANLYDTPLQGS